MSFTNRKEHRFCVSFGDCGLWWMRAYWFLLFSLPPTGSVLWSLCRMWRRTWRRREVRSRWVLSLPVGPSVTLSACVSMLPHFKSFKVARAQLNPEPSYKRFAIKHSRYGRELFSLFLLLLCVIFCQVFDATNTTRERRDLILAFVKENAFKVKLDQFCKMFIFCNYLIFSFLGFSRIWTLILKRRPCALSSFPDLKQNYVTFAD